MKKVLAGIVMALAAVLIYRSCAGNLAEERLLQERSRLLQQQVENVSKLIVTEGHFSEVFTYEDTRQLFGTLVSADKKALVVVNADVTISYDLRELDIEWEAGEKTVYLLNIPEPEIKISPDLEYYDVQADYLNPFEAKDYNTIKERVKDKLLMQVRASSLMENAQNRLISELSNFYLLTSSMDWKLVYEGEPIESMEAFELIH